MAERDIEVWGGVVKVINHWFTLPASKKPKENKYDMLVEHHKDSFMLAELHFFKYIVSTFKPFFTSFQTDNPMMPFLFDTIEKFMTRLMQKFMNKEVLEEANTACRLYKVDLTDKKIFLLAEQVDIGTAVKSTIKLNNLPYNKKLQFRKCCLEMLISIVKKFQRRSNLKYAIVQNSSSLSPILMACEPEVCKIRFLSLVHKLSASKWISEKVAEDAKVQFLSSVSKEHQLKF